MFRQRESDLIAELCNGESRVLATGGGAWVDKRNRDALRAHYRTVVLSCSLDVIARRVTGSDRPLWDETVEARYKSRATAYADAERIVDANRAVEAIVKEIVVWLDR